ncbi:hypothetical protein ACFV0W_19990, partial [Streptomyces anulatus]
MRGGFTGWPEQAMDVLWQLQGEPAHAARERCRADPPPRGPPPQLAPRNPGGGTAAPDGGIYR